MMMTNPLQIHRWWWWRFFFFDFVCFSFFGSFVESNVSTSIFFGSIDWFFVLFCFQTVVSQQKFCCCLVCGSNCIDQIRFLFCFHQYHHHHHQILLRIVNICFSSFVINENLVLSIKVDEIDDNDLGWSHTILLMMWCDDHWCILHTHNKKDF